MRLISYLSPFGPRVAVKQNSGYIDLHEADSSLPTSMREFLQLGNDGLRRAEAILKSGQTTTPVTTLMAPVPDPGKIICVGLNYADHAKESGSEPPPEPVIFNKFGTAVCAHDDAIVLPQLSNQVDYEAELVVVIGSGGRGIAVDDALSRVAGYCCGHDVSARDWQLHKPGKQWLLGKSFDTFAPFGPELVTADEVDDPGNLRIQLRLNGETMQDSSTRQLIFSVAELVSYVSGVCTLYPGDVIFTGTPPGVGVARKPPRFLQPGDNVEVEIEKLGILRNKVTSE